MRHAIAFLLLIATLTLGCSALTSVGSKLVGNALGASDDGVSVELDAQVGDRQNDVKSQIGGVQGTGEISAEGNAQVQVTTKATESNVERAEKVAITNNKQAPFWLIVLLILGWVLPDPVSMWTSFRNRRSGSVTK